MINQEKTIEFSAKKNSIDLLYGDDRFCVVSVDLLHEDDEDDCNRNMCNISHEANLKSLDSIYNTTISCRYNSVCKDLVTDVVEHYSDAKERFETRIIGHFPPDARISFVKRENGKTYLNVEGIIHKNLVPEFMKILKNSDGDLKVSTVLKCSGHQDDETGIFYIEQWTLQTTTVLSDKIREGIEGSHLEIAEEPDETQIKNANEVYMQFAYKKNPQDIFEEIKNKQKKETTTVNLGVRELEARLWECLKKYEYSDGGWRGKRYWIHNILTDSKEVVVFDNQTDELYKIPYKVDKNGDVTVKEEDRKKVVEDKDYREVANTWTFAKEEYGTGDAIEVDKSKEAMSEKDWGKVNKTALRNKVLDAKNYKELVHDVYLVVEEGWEDAPSEKLKYPVMEIVGGKAVYNRYGLASALGYAKANGEEEVVKKVEKLYEDLEIEDGESKKEENTEEKNVENSEVIIEPVDEEAMKKEWEEKYLAVQNECDTLKNECDGWKNKCEEIEGKYNEIVEKCAEMEKALAVYKEKEDKEEMRAYLASFKKCFAKDEYEVIASEIDKTDKAEFVAKVDEKVKEYVRKMSEKDDDDADEEDVYKNSFRAYPNFVGGKKAKTSTNSLDDVLNKLNNK